MNKLTLGISSCPNDTFMFGNLLNNRKFKFDLRIEDIETLNAMAYREETDITKLSFHAWLKLQDKYQLLNSGGALGKNCGPILVSKHKAYPDEIHDMTIAIPGDMTTANLLLSIFYPDIKSKKPYVFSDIEEAIMDEEVDAGLIIHENRFTYQQKGLNKIVDLGELWEKTYHVPTPLGGIAIHRRINESTATSIDKALHGSIVQAFDKPESVMPFVKQHAQAMDTGIMKKHIGLYVNHYSLGNDDAYRKSIRKLSDIAQQHGLIPSAHQKSFVKHW
ncbi:MAG: 1,4-dihydroxy-6-naphthoate synthase [Bacteroidales bacterium]